MYRLRPMFPSNHASGFRKPLNGAWGRKKSCPPYKRRNNPAPHNKRRNNPALHMNAGYLPALKPGRAFYTGSLCYRCSESPYPCCLPNIAE